MVSVALLRLAPVVLVSVTAPPLTTVPLPVAALGAPPAVPIAARVAFSSRPVARGQSVATPCFTTVVPVDGTVRIQNCDLDLTAAADASPAGSGVPYVSILVDHTEDASMEAMRDRVLATFARVPRGDGSAIQYGDDHGPYLGSRDVAMFARPALALAWGSAFEGDADAVVSDRATEFLEIVAAVPPNRYALDGSPLNGLAIGGHSIGYEAAAFASAVAHLAMR